MILRCFNHLMLYFVIISVFGCINDFANNFNPEANVAIDVCEYGQLEDSDYYDLVLVTEISMSIIMPYYPLSNSLSVSNVEFTGDVSAPFDVGSTIGVFFRDHNLQLVCGGSSQYLILQITLAHLLMMYILKV